MQLSIFYEDDLELKNKIVSLGLTQKTGPCMVIQQNSHHFADYIFKGNLFSLKIDWIFIQFLMY